MGSSVTSSWATSWSTAWGISWGTTSSGLETAWVIYQVMDLSNTIIVAVGLFLSIGAGIWGQALWLSKQFSMVRELVHIEVDKLERGISQKMEYHERHDDDRFGRIRDDLWEIRVSNAAKQGGNGQFKKICRDTPRRK